MKFDNRIFVSPSVTLQNNNINLKWMFLSRKNIFNFPGQHHSLPAIIITLFTLECCQEGFSGNNKMELIHIEIVHCCVMS